MFFEALGNEADPGGGAGGVGEFRGAKPCAKCSDPVKCGSSLGEGWVASSNAVGDDDGGFGGGIPCEGDETGIEFVRVEVPQSKALAQVNLLPAPNRV